ncbi:MAG: amidohydrolase [Deltaproteobacteria bacterium]|nr:amidohydrolase [Deltaproteobacteria bacterium]
MATREFVFELTAILESRSAEGMRRAGHGMLVGPERGLAACALLLLALLGIGCGVRATAPLPPLSAADLVFLGDHILTIDPATEGAQGVAVRGDTIAAVGSRSEIERRVGPATRVVELGERALLPGFIDAHGHLGLVMLLVDDLNASSPPVGPMKSIEDIVAALQVRIAERRPAPGEFVVGYGYDDSLLVEGRHPTRDDLDRASRTQPIVLLHVSSHLAAANSAALAAIGVGPDTPDPAGGVIRRREGSREPSGVLEEAAIGPALASKAQVFSSPEQFGAALEQALAYHARFGITTVQDGASSPAMVNGLRAIASKAPLVLDVAAYLREESTTTATPIAEIGHSRRYVGGVRIAGVKFVLDGSPQGRTAWMTRPYLAGPPGRPADYRAYPTIDPAFYRARAAELMAAGVPFLAHANGDAAIDLMIGGVDGAVAKIRRSGQPVPDHRSIAIHAQLARPDQLDAMKRLGILPSFFAAHPFFWGDWHRKSFGDARALAISPLRSAHARGLRYSIHNDAPVVPPDVLRLVEIAVRRETRSGFVLGANERVTVEEALRAVTLDAAYGYFEEDRKGSLAPGKRADFVVLSGDPRRVPTDRIDELEILETYSRGRSVYSASEAGAGGAAR